MEPAARIRNRSIRIVSHPQSTCLVVSRSQGIAVSADTADNRFPSSQNLQDLVGRLFDRGKELVLLGGLRPRGQFTSHSQLVLLTVRRGDRGPETVVHVAST